MSRRAWGGFVFGRPATEAERVDFSFLVARIASECVIGIKFGWNVWPELQAEFQGNDNVIPFEPMDNPMTNIADVLFVGAGIWLFVEGKTFDTGESLDSRITRVRDFLQRVLESHVIEEMVLHIDSGFGEEIVVESSAREFKAKILEMYKQMNSQAPSAKFISRQA